MKLNKNLSIFLTATMTLLINVNLINAAVSNDPDMTENEKNSDTLIELYGDADATGILTAADSSAILQKVLNSGAYFMPIENKTSDYMKYIDVTADGMLTSADSAAVLQKVLNSAYIMPIEQHKNTLSKLELSKSGWAYPNVVYWSLANYPQNTKQDYVVTLYKNGQIVDTVKHTIPVKETEDVMWDHTQKIAHIDFTDIIKEDITGSYTFSVQAIGDDNTTADSDVMKNDVPYIYNDGSDNNPSVAVSSDNTIQLKLFNSAVPFEWKYSLDNDIIKLKSNAVNAIYHAYYDEEPSRPGNIVCERYNFEPVTPGEVTISFGFYDIFDEKADVLESKTVKLKVNDDLSVSIIE